MAAKKERGSLSQHVARMPEPALAFPRGFGQYASVPPTGNGPNRFLTGLQPRWMWGLQRDRVGKMVTVGFLLHHWQ